MGHIRLKRLPASRKWTQVVGLLGSDAPVADVAAASADAADSALQSARRDAGVAYSVWLLTQLPFAARTPDFEAAAARLGINIGGTFSVLDIAAAFSDAVDRATSSSRTRTDLGEMARRAAIESLSAFVTADLPGLFGSSAQDVRLALGKLAAPDRFARLARDFFARLTHHHLDYYVSRTIADHVGTGRRLATVTDHAAFNAALAQHCQEASRIVEAFAGGWFSKTTFKGGITPAKARDFVFVALGKINAELRHRSAAVA